MLPNEAKTYLSLCPPGDETNPDVPHLAKARELTLTNPELAAWWEQEKSFDLLFGQKLSSLKPPPELQPTIMRGGATIFFASRLIAESANEEDDEEKEETAFILPSAGAAALAETGRPPERDKLAEMESSLTKRWIWRMGLVMVGVIGMLVIVFLFFFEYNIASKDVASKIRHGPAGELAKLESIALDLNATAVPATEAGPSLIEMRNYLIENHSPNPPELPNLITQPAPGDVITVAAEFWDYIPITHFKVQAGLNLSHLAILKMADLQLKEEQLEAFLGTSGPFTEKIWGANGYVYIQLTPTVPLP